MVINSVCQRYLNGKGGHKLTPLKKAANDELPFVFIRLLITALNINIEDYAQPLVRLRRRGVICGNINPNNNPAPATRPP